MSTPSLPKFINTKIYKTGQTRGADDDAIYQNRVGRNSTVLIPLEFFEACTQGDKQTTDFEKGFIVLVNPEKYFLDESVKQELERYDLEIGINALLFYQTRNHWEGFNPFEKGLKPAVNRIPPLDGDFISRVASTTSETKNRENHGFITTSKKGAGIRVFEYADKDTISLCRIQLEYLFWSCFDSIDQCVNYGMSNEDAILRKQFNHDKALESGLSIKEELIGNRMINKEGHTVCPLCLEELSSSGFFKKVLQAEGRSVHDLTVTEINLFHIKELRMGAYNHKPYNLGWGHHHCNIVVKDAGILETLEWMESVVQRNKDSR